MAVAPGIERVLFDGDVRLWLNGVGLTYDQRNSIVVGIAMGFAVIPIIFTISDDAFQSVPSSLTAASLALGASRWQTAIRVVVPTASPGVFSAVMIGFGRAIGETMIVLMATGNTPVMDWSPFNGMRTLSANIAVEIPEAPVDGTLYRVLFLSATLLFAMTFVINTIAELIRQRLRDRYKAV
jgi:phosphate transport system permease protein